MFGKKLPSVFKSKGPRPFGFKPRYYDEDKERLETRKRIVESELLREKEVKAGLRSKDTEQLRSEMRANWSSTRHVETKKSNYRVILLVLTLALAAYYVFFK